jgi:hypothetical protein
MTLTQQQQQNWSVWEERWQALSQTLADLASYYDGLPSDFHRKKTLSHLVTHLQAFGDKQFNFFLKGFIPQIKPILLPSGVFQPEYVFSATLDQISHDLEVIQRAANARLPICPKRMRDTLDIADKLAWKYLKPALDANLVEEGTTVLTYFQKSPSIRLIPYAPVALIGIPPTAILRSRENTTDDTLVAQDLLTTAHEVGHYVYRHGTFNGKPIYRELADRINNIHPECKHWLEEICADTFCLLSGGAVTALSSQDLALHYYSLTEFFKDDGEHPPPKWRPYIYVKVLKEKGNGQMDQIADDLSRRWDDHRNYRKDSGQIELDDHVIALELEITDTEPVDRIISEVLDIFKDVKLDSSDKDSVVDNLYRNFRDKFVNRENENYWENWEAPQELDLGDPDKSWEGWLAKEEFFPQYDNHVPPSDAEISAGTEEAIFEPPTGDWLPVAYCAGWTTKIGNHSGG